MNKRDTVFAQLNTGINKTEENYKDMESRGYIIPYWDSINLTLRLLQELIVDINNRLLCVESYSIPQESITALPQDKEFIYEVYAYGGEYTVKE